MWNNFFFCVKDRPADVIERVNCCTDAMGQTFNRHLGMLQPDVLKDLGWGRRTDQLEIQCARGRLRDLVSPFCKPMPVQMVRTTCCPKRGVVYLSRRNVKGARVRAWVIHTPWLGFSQNTRARQCCLWLFFCPGPFCPMPAQCLSKHSQDLNHAFCGPQSVREG